MVCDVAVSGRGDLKRLPHPTFSAPKQRKRWSGVEEALFSGDYCYGRAACPGSSSSPCQYTAMHPVKQLGKTLLAGKGTNM